MNALSRVTPVRDRLLSRLVEQPNGCMHWTGVIDKDGYGRVGYKGRRSTPLQQAVYDCFVGPIPDDAEIDHQCHNEDQSCPGGRSCLHRRCGSWLHLVAVTHADNTLGGQNFSAVNSRKTRCPQDHEYTPDNTYRVSGRRFCIACWIDRHGSAPLAGGAR